MEETKKILKVGYAEAICHSVQFLDTLQSAQTDNTSSNASYNDHHKRCCFLFLLRFKAGKHPLRKETCRLLNENDPDRYIPRFQHINFRRICNGQCTCYVTKRNDLQRHSAFRNLYARSRSCCNFSCFRIAFSGLPFRYRNRKDV